MNKEITYNEAFKALENLVAEIEDDNLKLDDLAAKVSAANELVKYCETRLRVIADDAKGN